MVVQTKVGDCEMTVYNTGFAVYQNDLHYTVLRMEYVGKANYYSEPLGKRECIGVEDEDWTIGVMLCGEERLEKRYCEMADGRLTSMYTTSEDGEVEEMEIDSGEDFVEDIATRDEVHSILDCLTERQLQVVEMYYLEHLTQQQIADKLGIAQQNVDKAMRAATKKIQKNFSDRV